MSTPDPRIEKLEAEIVRLQHELEVLQRQWNKKHLLALFGLAAIPAYFLFGPLVAGVVLVCTPALIATQAYLLYVRRAECRQLIVEARREIDYMRGDKTVRRAGHGSPFDAEFGTGTSL